MPILACLRHISTCLYGKPERALKVRHTPLRQAIDACGHDSIRIIRFQASAEISSPCTTMKNMSKSLARIAVAVLLVSACSAAVAQAQRRSGSSARCTITGRGVSNSMSEQVGVNIGVHPKAHYETRNLLNLTHVDNCGTPCISNCIYRCQPMKPPHAMAYRNIDLPSPCDY